MTRYVCSWGSRDKNERAAYLTHLSDDKTAEKLLSAHLHGASHSLVRRRRTRKTVRNTEISKAIVDLLCPQSGDIAFYP